VPQSELDVDVALTGAIDAAVNDVEVPVGLFDVRAQLDAGQTGLLRRAVGLPGMKALGPVEVALAVASECPDVNDVRDCDGDRDTEDEDDDADGQADADEPGCVGAGLGTDHDHHCLCEPADPFPGCQSNDPVACDLVEAPDCAP
jgi:hypothetical protein